MRSHRSIALLLLCALALPPAASAREIAADPAATVTGEPFAWGPIPDEPRPRPRGAEGPRRYRFTKPVQDWQQRRLHLFGGLVWPWSFAEGWRSGTGWAFAGTRGIAPWGDLYLDIESYRSSFDESALEDRGASQIQAVGRARIGDIGFGVRIHAPRLGSRLYGTLGTALPWVTRPTVSYVDANGSHQVEGSSGGAGPGVVLGAGFEHATTDAMGASIEGRWLIVSGGMTPTEHAFILRAGLSLLIPRR